MTQRCQLLSILVACLFIQSQAFAQDATSATDLDQQSKILANEKAAIDLQKAQLDYATAKYNIPNSGFTGGVGANQISATAETNILYSRMLSGLASNIASKVASACSGKHSFILYAGADKRSLADLRAFDIANTRMTNELKDADDAFRQLKPPKLPAPTATTSFAPVIIAAGLAALSMLKSDYTLGGAQITTTDSQLMNLIAAHLQANGRSIYFAAEYTPAANAAFITDALKTLDKSASTVAEDNATATRWMTAAKNAKLADEVVGPYQDVATKLQTALTDYQTWVKSLSTPDATGDTPLMRANVQALVGGMDTCAASVHVDSAAGSNYSKKNIWTGIGTAMPFYASAEATASYRVWNSNGSIAASGMFQADSGWEQVDKIHRPGAYDSSGVLPAPQEDKAQAAAAGTAH